MRKLALLVPLLLAMTSCQGFSWAGQGAGLSQADRDAGLKDIAALTREYETKTYFARLRRRMDGAANAFGRDLASIQTAWGRHFLNYSVDDPYVNYPSSTTSIGHLGRFTTSFVGSILR